MDTEQKLRELNEQGKPVGCLCCGNRLDDGYDENEDIWYCPAMDEE